MKLRIFLISLFGFLLLINCSHKSSPTEPIGTADLSISMLLKPAEDNGYNVTRVHVQITRNTFLDSMDLSINGDQATGTFTDLKVGTYQIEVWVYEDTTLIATGSGSGEVKAGQTVNVTINVAFLTGNLAVTVNWGTPTVEPNTIYFEMETGATVDIEGVKNVVNGTINRDYVEWEEDLSSYDPTDDGLHDSENFPDDVKLVFKLSKNGKFSVKAFCTSDNYEHIFTVITWGKHKNAKADRSPSDKWIKSSYYDKTVAADFNDLKELYVWNLTLTGILGYEFGYFYENKLTSNGPEHIIDFMEISSKNSKLLSGFTSPILLLFSMIRHQQADYSWYLEKWREWDTYVNSHFSVAPNNVWNLDFSSKRYFNISIDNSNKICTFASANNDNSNSSKLIINNNDFVSRTNCCGNELFDFSIIPTKVEINAYSVWSWIGPHIEIITQADNITVSNWHEERDGVVDPADSWDQNPKPLILKIDKNGTTIVE